MSGGFRTRELDGSRATKRVSESEIARDSARGEWRQMKAEFLGLRDELKSAIYEKLNSSLEEKKRVLQILRRTIDEIRSK